MSKMFKLIKAWWKDQWLSEGEQQVKFKEDATVTKQQSTPTEEEITEYGYIEYLPSEKTHLSLFYSTSAMERFTLRVSLNTFTLYSPVDRSTGELKPPVKSLLLVIKKAFDEESVKCDYRGGKERVEIPVADFTLHYIVERDGFCTVDTLFDFKFVTSILDDCEEGLIRKYISRRVLSKRAEVRAKQRQELEDKLQSFLNGDNSNAESN